MKITAEFNSVEELVSFAGAFGTKVATPVQGGSCSIVSDKVNSTVKEDKPTTKASEVKVEIVKQDPPKGETIDADSKSVDETTKADEESPKGEAKITKEMVREVFTKIMKAGKQNEAKALTTKYGATKLPEVKEEDYAAIFKEAEALL